MGSQHLVSLRWDLQPFCYVGHGYEILQLHHETVPHRLILPRTSLSLGLSRLLGSLPSLTLLVRCSFMHPHGLRTWARGHNTRALSFNSPFAAMCTTARRLISAKVLGRFLMRDSLKGPGQIPFRNAWTIIVSSLVATFTTCALKRFTNSFNVSPWYCLTSKRS